MARSADQCIAVVARVIAQASLADLSFVAYFGVVGVTLILS